MEMVRLCVQGRLQNYLGEAAISHPVYNFFVGFDENAAGPWDSTPIPEIPESPVAWTLMDIPVRFPIGVPASGLTANSRWIRYFARRGFNVLTYKTVRSSEYGAHRWPHWVFIQDVDPWSKFADRHAVKGDLSVWPKDFTHFSTANSFGVPSPHPNVWRAEVEQSLSELSNGQLLIVSVMGTAEEHEGTALIDDFVKTALMAESTGARAIELNLSCPNTVRSGTGRGMRPLVCSDAITTEEIVGAVRAALKGTTKLVAKLGYLEKPHLAEVVGRIANSVDAISGINTIQVPITAPNSDITPFVGTATDASKLRVEAGISGSAIRNLGEQFVRNLADLRGDAKFEIIGMGGIMNVSDVGVFRKAGAAAVQTATGACLNPNLPIDILNEGSYISTSAVDVDQNPSPRLMHRIARVVASGGYSLLSESR